MARFFLRIPRTLPCPDCLDLMFYRGYEPQDHTHAYQCAGCLPGSRLKRLHVGQVVRAGSLGFGFVKLDRFPRKQRFQFQYIDFVGGTPRQGDLVLVLLYPVGFRARRVWRIAARPARRRRNHYWRIVRHPEESTNYFGQTFHHGGGTRRGEYDGHTAHTVEIFVDDIDAVTHDLYL